MKVLLITFISLVLVSCKENTVNQFEEDKDTFLGTKECLNQIDKKLVLKESISDLNTKINMLNRTDEPRYYLENPEAKGILDYLPCNLPENFKVEGKPVKVSLRIYEYPCRQGEDCLDSRFLTAVIENINSL